MIMTNAPKKQIRTIGDFIALLLRLYTPKSSGNIYYPAVWIGQLASVQSFETCDDWDDLLCEQATEENVIAAAKMIANKVMELLHKKKRQPEIYARILQEAHNFLGLMYRKAVFDMGLSVQERQINRPITPGEILADHKQRFAHKDKLATF